MKVVSKILLAKKALSSAYKLAEDDSKTSGWKSQVHDVLGSDYHNSDLDFDTWSEMIFSGEMPDGALELLDIGDKLFGTEKASDMFAEIVERFAKATKIASKKKSSKPKKVSEIAQAIERDNPDISPEQAYKMSWETLCSYVDPSYKGCTSKGKSKRKSPKSSY
jgi:hypothetical protein